MKQTNSTPHPKKFADDMEYPKMTKGSFIDHEDGTSTFVPDESDRTGFEKLLEKTIVDLLAFGATNRTSVNNNVAFLYAAHEAEVRRKQEELLERLRARKIQAIGSIPPTLELDSYIRVEEIDAELEKLRKAS